jgi:hypothetical protein
MASRMARINRVWMAGLAIVALVVVTAVAGIAAPNKTFTWSVAGGGTAATAFTAGSTGNIVNVTVRNTTASATINSFTVTVPGALTVEPPATPATLGASCATNAPPCLVPPPTSSGGSTNANASATVTVTGQRIDVQFLDPIKNNQVAVLRIKVTAPAATGLSCGDNSITWPSSSVVAWTGSNLSGSNFVTTSTATTHVSKTCTLSFTGGIADGLTNTNLTNGAVATDPVKVTLSQAVAGVTVTITKVSGPGSLTGTTSDGTDANGVAEFSDLQLSAAGDYTLKAAATGYGEATTTVKIFETEVCGGDSYSETGTSGSSITITANEGNPCFAVNVTFQQTNGQQEWTLTKSGDPHVEGTLTADWKIADPSVVPVPWTQVDFGTGFHNVKLCLAGADTQNDWASQFPAGEDMCLVSSDLRQVGSEWKQLEVIAVNADLGVRKG